MELYVWGTGCAAGDLVDAGMAAEQITAFVDSAPMAPVFLGRPVVKPEALRGKEDALILVASRHTDVIASRAAALGLRTEQLLFLKNNWSVTDLNVAYELAEEFLPREMTDALRRPQHAVREPLCLGESVLTERDLGNDYVRMRTLELICRELTSVPGEAAELGVYRGGFARCINALLPERTLYLFDTFEGFDDREAAGYGVGFRDAHKNTGTEKVLCLMPHPEKVRVRQGLFPATAEGLEESFALVSLDVDLEESTLEGLRWFYPRMSPGGYLLLHDGNSPKLPGVRRALERFRAEWTMPVPAVPVCDINGTLVLPKL